jgi:hypothetical protein
MGIYSASIRREAQHFEQHGSRVNNTEAANKAVSLILIMTPIFRRLMLARGMQQATVKP